MTEIGVNPSTRETYSSKMGSIENTKPETQIGSHQNPTPQKSKWGINFHRKKVYATKGYR
jgi:hypothetical protein